MKNKEKLYSIALVSTAFILFLIFALSTASAAAVENASPTITETRITTSGLASDPAIYGDRIAYTVTSDSDPDYWIDVYDLSTKSVIASSDYDNYETFPDIYGNRLVFDSANGISVYDFSTKETQYIPSHEGRYPKIHGDRIVWSDNDVYMYDLSTKKEIQITTNESATGHAIYGNRIVWTNYNQDRLPFSDTDIYMYDLSTLEKTEILSYISASNLEIYGNKILWVNHHEMLEPEWGPNDDITVYDLSTNSYASISTNGSTGNPDIYMDKVVWQDNRDGNSNIYMYDLSTNTETQITTSGSAYNPQIYGNRIVWQDNRNGGSDIYMATLNYPIYPAADFSSNVTEGYAPLTVQFTDLSENVTEWNWDFGDGTYSTEKNPIHTYSTAGIYKVKLTVINENGTDSKLAKINVSTPSVLPVFPGYTNPPTDPNHDNLYEDINGNGILDFDDVVAYYDNMDWIEGNASVAFFDYNKNGLIDFDDIVKLYDML